MLECPEKLQGLRANDIDPSYLYSYWLTVYFVIYALAYLVIPNGWVPKWMNPYPTIIIGTVVQAVLFALGSRAMPVYFIAGVAIWKLVLVILTLIILPVDWTPMTVGFNLAVLGCYFIYMFSGHGINPFDLYSCIVGNNEYFPKTINEFLAIRLNVQAK